MHEMKLHQPYSNSVIISDFKLILCVCMYIYRFDKAPAEKRIS